MTSRPKLLLCLAHQNGPYLELCSNTSLPSVQLLLSGYFLRARRTEAKAEFGTAHQDTVRASQLNRQLEPTS